MLGFFKIKNRGRIGGEAKAGISEDFRNTYFYCSLDLEKAKPAEVLT